MLDIAVLQEFLYIFITLCSKIEFSGFGGFGGGFSGFFSEESMFDSVGFGWKAGVWSFPHHHYCMEMFAPSAN